MAKKTKDNKEMELERCVNMSNALIRAAQSLSLSEKRLLMLGVSKLDTKKPPSPDNMAVSITAREFAEQFGVSLDTAYNELKTASKQLFHRYISFYWDNNQNFTQMHWVGQATYRDKEGVIKLEFWHKLAPQLFELSSLFTSYRLSRAAALRSVYSWRLFELLMQFKKTGWLRISIEEFCHAVEAPERYRKDFGQLRRSVIEPAVKEIREKDGLNVIWDVEKAGRKVKTLSFKFPLEHQVALPLPPKTDTTTPKTSKKKTTKSKVTEPNESTKTQVDWVKNTANWKQIAQLLKD